MHDARDAEDKRLLDAKEHIEYEARYQRVNGYESLTVNLAPL